MPRCFCCDNKIYFCDGCMKKFKVNERIIHVRWGKANKFDYYFHGDADCVYLAPSKAVPTYQKKVRNK